jgi:hypothetical protein
MVEVTGFGLTDSGVQAGNRRAARRIAGRVWRRYATTADTEVSRLAAQTRAWRYVSSLTVTVMFLMIVLISP